MKWEYRYTTPNNGKVYHKNNFIMILYTRVLKLFEVPKGKEMLPCYGKERRKYDIRY